MSNAPDRRAQLKLQPELDPRTRFCAEADRTVINDVRCGVLFVMAFWSGPSWLALSALKSLLVKYDTERRFNLIVVDTDGCPDLYELPEFRGMLAGAGETAWIVDGRIVRTCLRPTREELQRQLTTLLTELKAAEGAK